MGLPESVSVDQLRYGITKGHYRYCAMTQQEDDACVVDHDKGDNILWEFDSNLARLNQEAEAILNSIRHESGASHQSLRRCETPVTSDDDNDDAYSNKENDDLHDDDEMNDEISRLGSVVASLQQDLDKVAHVVTSEFGVSVVDSPVVSSPLQVLSTSAIDSNDDTRMTDLVKPSRRSTMGRETMNVPLMLVNLLVWTVVVFLVLHVKYTALDNDRGSLPFIPVFAAN